MEIVNLKVNRLKEPTGISENSPVFSCVVAGNGCGRIKSVQIDVSTDITFKNIIFSQTRKDVIFSGFRLPYAFSGGIKYFWRVTVVNEKDERASGMSYFECGRKQATWNVPFITTFDFNDKSAVFYRKFPVNDVREARLYITGLGLYEAYINGKKVGDEYFTPYFNDYRYLLQYQTFDIEKYLTVGENEITVLCGNGIYGGRHPNGENGKGAFGCGFKLSAEITVGGENILTTDDKWLSTESPVVFSEIYDGEIYDARIRLFDENGRLSEEALSQSEKVKLCNNTSAKIIARISPSVKVREELLPMVIITPLGDTVLDYGEEITGFVEFTAKIPYGESVKLSYGEIMQNGEFYRDHLRTARAEYIAMGNGKKETYRAHFTYYGFRFVKVEGIEINDEIAKNFVGKFVYSDLEPTGKIVTDNEKLNKFFGNVIRSQKDNFLDIPLDCPQRDERFGWTGDAQVFSETAMYNADCFAFYSKYLADMREEQIRYGGACPFIVPDCFYAREELNEGEKPVTDVDFMIERVSPCWGDSAVIIPWNIYRFTGDKEELKKNYVNMKNWTDFLLTADLKHGGGHVYDYGFRFGDWLALDNPDKEDKRGITDTDFICTAYYYNSVSLTAKTAEILGEKEDLKKYGKLAEDILCAIRKRYVFADGRVANDTQTAYALAIAFGLADNKTSGKRLAEKIAENGGELSTGFVGTAFLLNALTETGYEETAFDLMLNENLPGWLYSVNMGATTVWERWDSVLPDGSIRKNEMNSLNHYAYGAVVAWLYKSVVGINADENEAGFKRANIKPVLNERLKKVYGEYYSVYGKYSVGYEITGNVANVKVTVPYLCEATFFAPKGYKIKTADGKVAVRKNVIIKGGKHTIRLISDR